MADPTPTVKLSKGQHAWLKSYRLHALGYDQPGDEWFELWTEVQAGREITELESLRQVCESDIDRWTWGERDEVAARDRGYGLRIIAKIEKAYDEVA